MILSILDRGGPTSPPFEDINLENWRYIERRLVS